MASKSLEFVASNKPSYLCLQSEVNSLRQLLAKLLLQRITVNVSGNDPFSQRSLAAKHTESILRVNISATNKTLLSDKSKVLLADIENLSKGLSHK
jgi:hypothetical protein